VRRSLPFLLVLLVLGLVVPAVAGAGGWATAGLSSTPEGVAPGQPWKVDVTVLQHGRTPLEGLQPVVRIRSGDATREFAATPTAKTGVYRAEVVFPSAGRWEYEVLDGFINESPHTFPAVEIGSGGAVPAAARQSPPPAAPADDGGIAAGWLWGAGAALVLAGAVLALDRRRRRPGAAPGAPEPA
jgi:hypothetical protein